MRKPLVPGAAIRFDGQLSVYDTRDAASPCYACVFPPDAEFEETRCAVLGVFAPVVGTIGTLQASEALKLLAGIAPSLAGRLLMFDGRRTAFDALGVAPRPGLRGVRPPPVAALRPRSAAARRRRLLLRLGRARPGGARDDGFLASASTRAAVRVLARPGFDRRRQRQQRIDRAPAPAPQRRAPRSGAVFHAAFGDAKVPRTRSGVRSARMLLSLGCGRTTRSMRSSARLMLPAPWNTVSLVSNTRLRPFITPLLDVERQRRAAQLHVAVASQQELDDLAAVQARNSSSRLLNWPRPVSAATSPDDAAQPSAPPNCPGRTG